MKSNLSKTIFNMKAPNTSSIEYYKATPAKKKDTPYSKFKP
jgi:hypothetical protein